MRLRAVSALVVSSILIGSCASTPAGESLPTTLSPPVSSSEPPSCEPGDVDGDLYMYNWVDYIDPQLILEFEGEYEVDVVEDFYDSNEAMLAKLQSGAVYDLVVPSDYMVGILVEEGLIGALERSAIPNIDNLADVFADPGYDPGSRHSVAYQWGTTGLAVNTEVVGEEFEPSWALVFDPEIASGLPGGVSLLNDPRETMGAALKYLGYSLNSTSEAELEEASNVIAEIREYVARFDSDRFGEALVADEVAVSHGFSGNFLSTIGETDDEAKYVYVVPSEGGTVWVDSMAIPTNAEHRCTAHAFIDFLLEGEKGAALTNWNRYASPNSAAEAFIDPAILEDDRIYPSDELSDRLELIMDTGEFEPRYTDFFLAAKG